jgi:hypothetical protein
MGQTSKSQAFKSPDFKFQAFNSAIYSTGTDAGRMADRVMQFAPATDAEALKLLRSSFPDCPLSMRVAALDFLMRRHSRALD